MNSKINKHNFWNESNYFKLDPLTDEMVLEAEKHFNVKLPKDYIEILKIQNGGYINLDCFPTDIDNYRGDGFVFVNYIWGIGKTKEDEEGIYETDYMIEEWELPKDIILICGDGHWWIFMDYRKSIDNPPIVYIDLEAEQEFKLADDFSEFLSKLYKNE